MKYIKQFTIILVVSFIGELLNYLIPLPVPASIYGLVIMLICLLTAVIPLHAVRDTGQFSRGSHAADVHSGSCGTSGILGRAETDMGASSGHYSRYDSGRHGSDRKNYPGDRPNGTKERRRGGSK